MSVNADSVVLVRVRVTCPGETKKDDFLTDEMRKSMGANEGWLTARKKLFDLSPITSIRERMRKTLRDEAVPWTATKTDNHGNKKQDPLWALPSRTAGDILARLQDMREQFMSAVRNFDYEGEIERARVGCAGAFNAKDFPSRKEFMERFTWDVEVMPLMDVADAENDFRLKLPKQQAEEQIQRYKKNLDTKVVTGVKDIMRRTVEKLAGDGKKKQGIIQKLQDYDPDPNDRRKNNSFRDKSIYERLDEYREWVGHMTTFLENEELEALHKRIGHFCDHVRPDDRELIRTDPAVRQKVISGLLAVLDEANPDEVPTPATKKSGFDQLL